MSHMDKVRARLADPATDAAARKRGGQITHRLKLASINKYALALQYEPDPKRKTLWLRKITDTLAKATEGIVPCKVGCSACCNMATLMSVEEAEEITRRTGIPHSMPSPMTLTRKDVDIEREQYTGVPCTFLKAGKCSIYEYRPHSCRVHYVLDKDALLCTMVPGELIEAPMFDNTQFNMLWVLSHPVKHPYDMRLADIREFFPEGANAINR